MQTITKQEEIEDLLISLGMSRTVASALAYMQDGKEATRTKLEVATRLRQPEVSIAMNQMIDRGWVDERNGMMTGKGRPYKIYSLEIPFKDIIAQLEEQQRKTGAGVQAKIERLKELRAS